MIKLTPPVNLGQKEIKRLIKWAEKEIAEYQSFICQLEKKITRPRGQPDWLCKLDKCSSCREWEKKNKTKWTKNK